MKKTKKGFTLIELIVVLAILAVIMAIAVPTAFGAIDSARKAADRGSIDGFNSAIRMKASILMADTGATAAEKTLGKAFEDSAISKTVKPQSTLRYKWEAPKEQQCGMFVEDAAGTALNPAGGSLYDQLLAIAKGSGATEGKDLPIIDR